MQTALNSHTLDETYVYKHQDIGELTKLIHREFLTTGISKMDEDFPFHTGYYVICANPGVGKGWFATWLTKQFYLLKGKRSVYFSLEMAEPLVRTRLLQQWSNLTQKQFNNGESVEQAVKLLNSDCLRVDTFHSQEPILQHPDSLRAKIDYYYSLGFRIFHFDHFHELEGMNVNNDNQRVAEVWGKAFQQLCKDYPDIWLFVFAQPNAEGLKKRILRKMDVSGSKSIVQKCEFFLSLNRSFIDGDDLKIDEEDRHITLWLDKSRITSASQIGWKLYFSKTGNFLAESDEEVL